MKEQGFNQAIKWANDKKESRSERNVYLFWILLAGIIGVIFVIWLITVFLTKSKELKSDTLNSEVGLEDMRKQESHDESAYLSKGVEELVY